MDLLVWGVILLLTTAAFYTDHTRMMIPNWLTGSGILIGVMLHAIRDGWDGLLYALTGMGGSLVIMLLIYACRGVEAGDVKWFAALGAIGGLELSFTSLVYSLTAAALVGLGILGVRKLRAARVTNEEANHQEAKGGRIQFPFMYAVLPGVILTFIMLEVSG